MDDRLCCRITRAFLIEEGKICNQVKKTKEVAEKTVKSGKK